MFGKNNVKLIVKPLEIMNRAFPSIILFSLLYKGFIMFAIKPLLSLILKLMLTVSGYQLAFNDFIVGFFLSPEGIIAAIIVAFISIVVAYFEFSVIILLVCYYEQKQRVSLLNVLREAGCGLKNLKNFGIIGFAIYVLGLLPIANMGISSTLVPQLDIPKFISGELLKNDWGSLVLMLFTILVVGMFLSSIFILPIMVLEKRSFGKALKRNFEVLKSLNKSTLSMYGVLMLTWCLMLGGSQFVFARIFHDSDITIQRIFKTYGFSWETVALLLLALVVFIIRLFLMPILLSLVTHNYMKSMPKEEMNIETIHQEIHLNFKKNKLFKRISIEATAGYYVYSSVGILDLTLTEMAIDFVVIEESMATKSAVYSFRKSWLPVYVWTVNDKKNMQP